MSNMYRHLEATSSGLITILKTLKALIAMMTPTHQTQTQTQFTTSMIWSLKSIYPYPSQRKRGAGGGSGGWHSAAMQDINCHPHVEFFNNTHGCKAGTSVPNHDTLPSHEQYKSNIGAANTYTPFKSELDWKTTQWEKM